MKKIALVLMAIVIVASIAMAQDAPAIKSGAKSLNFTFGGFGGFGLTGSGPGGGISVSHFMSDDAALRIGLQVAGASSTTTANPGVGQTGTDGSASAFVFAVNADYLMYMGTGRVRPYWGGGVGIAWGTNDTKSVEVGNPPPTQTEIKNNPAAGLTGIAFGLKGIVGAEWFLYNDVSISAEYNLNLITVASPADKELTVGNTTTTTKYGSATAFLGFGAAGATVHIYW